MSVRVQLYIVIILVCTTFIVSKSLRSPPNQYVPSSLDKEGASIGLGRRNKLHNSKGKLRRGGKKGVGMEEYPTGSSIPDCSHACGACFPCKRVMISFKCPTSIESCPIIYRCTCKGNYYHVPSN